MSGLCMSENNNKAIISTGKSMGVEGGPAPHLQPSSSLLQSVSHALTSWRLSPGPHTDP